MAKSSSQDDLELLQAALEHPFESGNVPLSTSSTSTPPPPPPAVPAPTTPSAPAPSETPHTEGGTWQTAYASQVTEWRAQSASVRTKAELARAKWETIRANEDAERAALGQPSESLDGLGDHITASVASANEIVSRSLSGSVVSLVSADHVDCKHVETHEQPEQSAEHAAHGKADGSPSQRWEHLSSSASSYPSMSFPETSVPQSPSNQYTALAPASASAPAQSHPHPKADHNPTNISPSTLPSIMDNRVAPRTRLSLVLSSLSINLLLPFINGVMLGFGEIFAKEVIIGWFGWKTRPGGTAAGVGLRR